MSLGVRVPERSAEERREPETEDRAQVTFGRRPQYPFVEAAYGLVHEGEGQPFGDVASRWMCRRAEELAHPRVGRAAPPVVAVEAAALVLALETLGHERVHDRRCGDTARLRDGLAGVPGDLEADLIDQLQRADRPAELGHGAINRLDGIAFGKQRERLADH